MKSTLNTEKPRTIERPSFCVFGHKMAEAKQIIFLKTQTRGDIYKSTITTLGLWTGWQAMSVVQREGLSQAALYPMMP